MLSKLDKMLGLNDVCYLPAIFKLDADVTKSKTFTSKERLVIKI